MFLLKLSQFGNSWHPLSRMYTYTASVKTPVDDPPIETETPLEPALALSVASSDNPVNEKVH